jgi:ABC-type glycerol-3-phosphate transport system permease component
VDGVCRSADHVRPRGGFDGRALQTSLLPLFRLYNNAGLNGTYLGIWLAHTGFGLPLATYLLYGYISQIPRDLIEAAEVDGTTPMTKFIYLVVPLSVPAIASFAIFQFLWVWNDLLVALVFLGTSIDVALVTTRLAEMVGSRGQDWYVLTSGAFLTMIMPLTVFFWPAALFRARNDGRIRQGLIDSTDGNHPAGGVHRVCRPIFLETDR